MADDVRLLIGTRKGAFIVRGNRNGGGWQVDGPTCEGWPIHDIAVEPESGTLFAGGGSPWYGATVFRSDDQGATWSQSSDGLTYGDDAEAPKIATVWNVGFGHGAVFAGVEPAGLFRSDDGGKTWSHVSGLRDHPSRAQWQPGAGGLILHSIVSDPDDARRMWVGISAVGVFETTDGGGTWHARNVGVRAEFNPENRFSRAYTMADWDRTSEREVSWVSGSCMLLRRNALDRVGLFDEGYFMYVEDADLCTRMRAAGWNVLFTPELEVTHVRGVSTGNSKRMIREHSRSIYRYFSKHHARGWRNTR